MTINPFFRFGLPLGHALILVAILDSVILIVNVFKEFGMILYNKYSIETDPTVETDSYELVLPSILVVLKVISNVGLLWIGGIFVANAWTLLAWVVTTAIFYLTIIISMFLQRKFMTPVELYYAVAIICITSIYKIIIGYASFDALKNREILQPLGKGVLYVWEYFSNDLQAAVKFCLASELIVDIYYLMTTQFLKDIFGLRPNNYHGSDWPAILVEQLVLKGLRIILNGVGLALVIKDKRETFRIWCFISLFLMLVSSTIFIFLAVTWRGYDIIQTLGLLLQFPGHLLYRSVVLYFCLRYTRVNFSSMIL